MAQYPTSDPTFTTKLDGPTEYIAAAHVNALQDEVAAIGAALRGTLAHDVTTSEDVIASKLVSSSGQYRALLYHNAATSLANATWTVLPFDTEDADVGTLHSTVSNTSRVTIPSDGAGLYLLMGTAVFAANATGNRQAAFYKNGTVIGTISRANPDGTYLTAVQRVALLTLAGGDYVEFAAYQDSGGALNAGHASTRTAQNQFQVIRLF